MEKTTSIAMKRCPGWHVGEFSGPAHEVPATTEYFHRSRAKRDGLNGVCKQCSCAYGRHRVIAWNQERALRKQRNESRVST